LRWYNYALRKNESDGIRRWMDYEMEGVNVGGSHRWHQNSFDLINVHLNKEDATVDTKD